MEHELEIGVPGSVGCPTPADKIQFIYTNLVSGIGRDCSVCGENRRDK